MALCNAERLVCFSFVQARRFLLCESNNGLPQRCVFQSNKAFRAMSLAPQVGFEPTADRLTADCSTTELLRSVDKIYDNTGNSLLQVFDASRAA